MDYRKLNSWTKNDHFPMPFMDQMLDRLSERGWYYFLDGYSGYNQISIAPENQEKTTFIFPYRTFQCCMLSIFADMVEDSMEVFMDDFSVVGDTFEECFTHLGQVLQRCMETNLVLNWEKCHCMVKEGIVLGLEVDKEKIEFIEKLTLPISVKGILSFLGHAGFYRRFIKDFSKIAHLQCKLLEKEVNFYFDDACMTAF